MWCCLNQGSIGHVRMVSRKALTLNWEVLMLEDGISGRCELKEHSFSEQEIV